MAHDLNSIVREHDPDLPQIGPLELKDGEHTVHHSPDGIKLMARVSNGTVTDWLAFDANGAEGTSVVIRKPRGHHPSPELSSGRWYIVCACFESGDFCWWVVLP